METYVLPTLYGIVFVVGISLNCTALLAYRGKPRPWSCNTIILFNLTLSDLLYLLNLPICMYNYIDQSPMTWPQVIFRCKFTTFAFYQNLYLSITILMWMSVYRCVGVVSPVRARQILRRRVVILSCVFMWLAVTLGLFKVATLEQTTDSNGTALCHDLSPVRGSSAKALLSPMSPSATAVLQYGGRALCMAATGFRLIGKAKKYFSTTEAEHEAEEMAGQQVATESWELSED
ncbi:unnamed protein product [Lampetra planeri]